MRILIPSIAIPLIAFLIYLFVPGLRGQPWTALRIGAAVLALIGYVLVTTARIQLGDSFTVRPEAKHLVTHGVYARIRNPIYVSVDLMLLGLIFALKGYWFLAALAVLVVFQARQARREAEVLQQQFGQSYLEYRNQTWF